MSLSLVEKIKFVYRGYGVKGVMQAVADRIDPPRVRCAQRCVELTTARRGLEIGGPSEIFSTDLLPVYRGVASLDNCNFSSKTVWEGQIAAGKTFRFDPQHEPGTQYILDASDMSVISSESYDFVLSSHTLEHLANPIKTLRQWGRVIKEQGTLIMILPHRDGTFDHRRPVTTLAHMLADETNNTPETDLSHLEECCRLHDFQRDPGVQGPEEFRRRAEQNISNRCLHHHVFDSLLVAEVLNACGFVIEEIEAVRPFHIVAIAGKPRAGTPVNNAAFFDVLAKKLKRSPFPSDRSIDGSRRISAMRSSL